VAIATMRCPSSSNSEIERTLLTVIPGRRMIVVTMLMRARTVPTTKRNETTAPGILFRIKWIFHVRDIGENSVE